MREIKLLSLDWHISRLKNREYYSFVRWDHNPINALVFASGLQKKGPALRLKFSPELNLRMQTALSKYYEEKDLIFACPGSIWQGINSYGKTWMKKYNLWNIDWVESTVFKGASNNGTLFPFIEELRKHKIIVIGPSFLKLLSKRVFKYIDFIEIHPKIGWNDSSIPKQILSCKQKYGNDILYAFSAGIGSCLSICNLHRSMNENFLIDFGSVWDNFCGRLSRGYMKPLRYPKSRLWRNLGKSEEECLKQEQLEKIERPQLIKEFRRQKRLKLSLQQRTHKKYKRAKINDLRLDFGRN